IAFDFNDIPNHFSEYALMVSDSYYKRSYQPAIVDFLPFKQKIRPMGLPFMVRPNYLCLGNKLRIYFFLFKMFEIFKLDGLFLKRMKLYQIKALIHYRDFVKTRKISDFENINHALSDCIFYQKRLFEERTDHIKELNHQRVERSEEHTSELQSRENL